MTERRCRAVTAILSSPNISPNVRPTGPNRPLAIRECFIGTCLTSRQRVGFPSIGSISSSGATLMTVSLSMH